MPLSDHYKTLGLASSASKQEIKAAYRRLARKYHPDVSRDANAEDKFKKVNQAYDVLSNLSKKKDYDFKRASPPNMDSGFTPPPGWKPGNYDTNFFEDIIRQDKADPKNRSNDFFDKIFSNRKKRASGHKSNKENIASISLSLDDIHQGTKRKIRLPNGQKVKVKIPKGIQEGQYIRLPKNKKSVELLLKVKLLPHPLFRLKGKDLHLDIPIAPWEAALGSLITVPTLDKNVKLTIPEGTVSGTKMRLKGRGLAGRPDGDLYITIQISTPPAHTESERNFYNKMKTEFAWNPRSRIM